MVSSPPPEAIELIFSVSHSLTQKSPRHNLCDDLKRTTEMKTFFDLSSWGPGFWGSGTWDLLMQYPHDPTDKNLSEAFVKFLLHWDPKTWSNSDVTLSEKSPVITATTTEETLRVKRSEGSSNCSDLINLPGEMVLFLLLAALPLFPTGEAGEWRSHPQRPRPTPHGTDLLTCYTHAHSGPGSCKEISELRSNFLKDHQPWCHLPSPAFASISTAGSLESLFQGKSLGGMMPSHTPIPYMAFFEYQFSEEIFSSGGFLVHKEFVLTAAHCLGRWGAVPGLPPSVDPLQGMQEALQSPGEFWGESDKWMPVAH